VGIALIANAIVVFPFLILGAKLQTYSDKTKLITKNDQ
jgi:hypothetical protein